jgi:hypothetical protein
MVDHRTGKEEVMDDPIVFISRNRIVPGRRDTFEAAFRHALDAIGSAKPRTALFAAYLDETGSEVHVVHVFPDADSMLLHFAGSEERSQAAAPLIEPLGFEVYGAAPSEAIAQLKREAQRAGFAVELRPVPIGGFLRAPA